MSEEERDSETSSSAGKPVVTKNGEIQIEEKIQVDRKRLEAMITGQPACGFTKPPEAEEFFKKVAQCTGAEIYWPSRLKIGAKTKKDPFVKVTGTQTQVDGARQMINTYLKIKRDRVTLKIEIHHSEHSKIIGRQGRNTQDIMRETMCHIHFPDSNKNHDLEKNDQVSISGSVEQVERARKWLRDLTPLTLTLELPNRSYQSFHEIQKNLSTKGLYITFRENFDGHFTCTIKSTQQYEAAITKAVVETAKFFQCPLNTVCKTVLIVRSSLRAIIAKDESLRRLAAQINTTIRPTSADGDEVNIHISGPVFGVLRARRCLIGLLPVSVHFDRVVDSNNDLIDKHVIETSHGVTVTEKWRKSQNPSKVSLVVVMGTERYIADVFRARERILDIFPKSLDASQESHEENRGFNSHYIVDPVSMDRMHLNKRFNQQKNSSFQKEGTHASSPVMFCDLHPARPYDSQTHLADALVDQPFNNKYEQKTPDPTQSPIAHSVLIGAKRIDEKRAEKKNQSREQLLLKANRATYDPTLTPVRHPTDFWSGYGFSNSLPAEVLKSGLSLFDSAIGSQYEARPILSQDSKIQPQLTNGLSSVLEEEEYNGNSSSNSNSFLSSSSFHNFQHLQQQPTWQTKQTNAGFSASTSVFDVGNDVNWDIRIFVDPAMVLAQLSCSEYLPQFREQEIDMEAFLLLDEKSLQDIGVSTIGARKKLFNAILSNFSKISCYCRTPWLVDDSEETHSGI